MFFCAMQNSASVQHYSVRYGGNIVWLLCPYYLNTHRQSSFASNLFSLHLCPAITNENRRRYCTCISLGC